MGVTLGVCQKQECLKRKAYYIFISIMKNLVNPLFSKVMPVVWRHDTQFNNPQHNDIQHDDTQHDDIQHYNE